MKLFTKEYLEKLEVEFSSISLLDFLINQEGYTFQEAIEAISKYMGMTPEYIQRSKKKDGI